MKSETAWACVVIGGSPYPYIHENSVRMSRADSQTYIGNAWARDGETHQQGWRRAYRSGMWRCVRVTVSLSVYPTT
jgi:hypothetical protein